MTQMKARGRIVVGVDGSAAAAAAAAVVVVAPDDLPPDPPVQRRRHVVPRQRALRTAASGDLRRPARTA
jgi:hypothetical protein